MSKRDSVSEYDIFTNHRFVIDYQTVSVEYPQSTAHTRSPREIDAEYPLYDHPICHTHRSRNRSRWHGPGFTQ